ncbi:hypothetical protein HSX11_16460 [Oxalobacteraceae bacterium]|nr:hypothetical protein [Oxalobacteraceae bacterium]
MKMLFMIAMLFGFSLPSAQAARTDAAAAECEGLKVATGKPGKGYSKLFGDIVKVSKGAIALCEVHTEGGLDNLEALSIKKADVGIVQIDALKKLGEGDSNLANLLVVATLNSNFLHIVVAANGVAVEGPKKFGLLKGDSKSLRVARMTELRDAPVALVGSAQLLVRQLDKLLGLNMQYVDVDTDEAAFKKVQSGEVYAAFTVAGWPHGPVSKLTPAQGLTLASFDGAIRAPYLIRPISYKGVGVYNVQALSIQNVLVTRSFAGARNGEVAALKRMLEKELIELKDGGYEPAWNEIRSLDAKVDWPRFDASSFVVMVKAKK